MRKFNINEFVWLSILSLNLTILSYLLITEKVFLIINSGTRIYIYIAIAIIMLMILAQFKNVFTVSTRAKFKGGYYIFLLSLVCLLVVSRVDIVKVSLEFKGVKLYHDSHSNPKHNHEEHVHYIDEENIIISNENFHEAMEELTAHINEYIGREIEINGVAYIDKKYEGKVIVTSIQLNCCIVDSNYIGILCDYNKDDIENGQPINVKGVINKTHIKNDNNDTIIIPIVEVNKIVT